MALTIDHRQMPEREKKKLPDVRELQKIPEPPEGQEIFMLPEPQMDWAEGVVKEGIVLNGVPVLALRRPGNRRDAALLHIHGGGFNGGSPVSAYRLMDAVCRRFGMDSFSVEYTLAPHARAPVQLEQCVAAYRGLLAAGYENVIVAGESAGANLSVVLGLALKDLGVKLPLCIVASSCVADFSGRIDRDGGPMKDITGEYAGELALTDWRISPIYGDFSAYPPLLLQAGELENLKADSLYLAGLLETKDCDCTLSLWENAFHAFGIDPGDTWVHREALGQILDFIEIKALAQR